MHDGRAVPQVVTYGWTHRAHARERAWNDQACFPRPIPGCPSHDDTCMLRVHAHECFLLAYICSVYTHMHAFCQAHIHAALADRVHAQECTRACSMMTHECFLQGTHTNAALAYIHRASRPRRGGGDTSRGGQELGTSALPGACISATPATGATERKNPSDQRATAATDHVDAHGADRLDAPAARCAGVRPCFPSAPWWWWHLPAVIYLPRPGWDLLASRARGGGGGICLPRPGWHRPEGFCKSTSNRKKRKWTQGGLVLFLWKASFSIKFLRGVFFGRLGKKEKSRPRSDQPRTSYLLVGSRLRLKACACSSSDEVTSFVSHRCLLIQTIGKLANLVIVPPGEFEKSTCGVTGDTNEERVRGTK